MSRYMIINILIFIFPFTLSFDSRVSFYSHWPAAGIAVIVVGGVFILWDAVFTARGSWSFNHKYIGKTRLGNLPLEEVLFFVTVPYACLFILQVLRSYLSDTLLPLPLWLFGAAAAVALAGVPVYRKRLYTSVVLAVTALFLILALLLTPQLLLSRNFWVYMALTYIPFLIFNGMLTSAPVVEYSSRAIWGVRVFSIPLEDFFYSFAMLGLSAMVYTGADRWL